MNNLKSVKKKYFVFMPIVVIILSFFLVHIVQAAGTSTTAATKTAAASTSDAGPGTDNDPLVTQGYVDTKITDLTAKLEALTKTVNDLTAKNAELAAKSDELKTQLQNAQQAQVAKFVPVNVKAGKQLISGEGTEMIVRAGQVKAIGGTGGGLSDITAGKDLSSGAAVVLNHLLLSSRDDGRGLKINTETWVLVKGTYKIK